MQITNIKFKIVSFLITFFCWFCFFKEAQTASIGFKKMMSNQNQPIYTHLYKPIKFSLDAQLLITTLNNTVFLWNLQPSLSLHTSFIHNKGFSIDNFFLTPDKKSLWTQTVKSLILWDVENQKQKKEITSTLNNRIDAAFLLGDQLITAHIIKTGFLKSECHFVFWNAASGVEEKRIVTAADFLVVSRFFVVTSQNNEPIFIVVNASSVTILNHQGTVMAEEKTNGKDTVALTKQALTLLQKNEVIVWNFLTHQIVQKMSGKFSPLPLTFARYEIKTSAHGEFIAGVEDRYSQGGELSVWDLSGKKLTSTKIPTGHQFRGMEFSSDNRFLAVAWDYPLHQGGGGTVVIFDLANKKIMLKYQTDKTAQNITWHPNSSILYVSNNGLQELKISQTGN